jgi:cytochrome c oxidase subunit III
MTDIPLHKEQRDDFGSKLGMWIFIFTEILLFGGLFLVYAVYRSTYPRDFHAAALHLDTFMGTLNTVLLLTSSMTVAMSITALQKNNKTLAQRLLAITLLLALAFLVNKYFEWGSKIQHQLYPGSELMLTLKHGYILFFGLYFFMTGLHALHILVGMILLTISLLKVRNGKITQNSYALLENSGLYWHLVDLIWIFLFPLLYLVS